MATHISTIITSLLRCFRPSPPPPPTTTVNISQTEPCNLDSPVIIYDSKNFKSESCCAICLEQLAHGDEARVLKRCMHVFHKDCIDEWLPNRSLTCPICRTCAVDHEVRTNESRRANCRRWEDVDFPASFRIARYL
ncbi:hypothetical protein DCAR_0729864 [Daucus carota subsp. sativus]|uniref:RING-type domain-containing protein n=1 Tax=Daucus carota subsp. sativus TaxID=79200 RepID=A0A164UII3_DAUCS|nr:PREDICTED: RING-H2 finger protein ATL73-like [Daucus carota subsp. sativus]WOH10396.1 hypothetical protein DCAR_0729864 [Daucus carota subsp. sativus]